MAVGGDNMFQTQYYDKKRSTHYRMENQQKNTIYRQQSKCAELQRGFEKNNAILAYETVEQLTKHNIAKSSVIEYADENLLATADKI